MVLILTAPIICLLVCLLVLKMPAKRASGLAFITSVGIYFLYYKSGFQALYISMAKGFGLSLFVVLIIWGAMFLFNLVNETGALGVINSNIEILIKDKFMQFLLLSWVFSSFLQGIAGFGVPVLIVAPILLGMGFDPVLSAAAVLVGHSWSISFGSMGSSIYAISMVTSAGVEHIVNNMSYYGIVAMLCTGIAVCSIYGGAQYIRRGFVYVLITTLTMGTTLFVVSKLGMFTVLGITSGLAGLVTLFIINKIKNRNEQSITLVRSDLNLMEALLPYILIVVLSITFNIVNPAWAINLSYPGYTTNAGFVVSSATNYVKFNILKYPFTIIGIASFISIMLYFRKGVLNKAKLNKVTMETVKKCTPTTVTIVYLLSMAVIMMDSGMVHQLALIVVGITNNLYPLVAPFIGLLGAFVTGSNTNSNIIFGNLQETAAIALNLSAAAMCAVQSIGASVGGGIGPTTVSLGAASVQLQGQESLIYKKTLIPIILTVLVLGIENLIIMMVVG